MSGSRKQDWDPRSEAALRDQRAVYDEMRERCPVAYSNYLEWSLFRHEDIVRVLDDPATFSNAASRHLSVPNGMIGSDTSRQISENGRSRTLPRE